VKDKDSSCKKYSKINISRDAITSRQWWAKLQLKSYSVT
jgi:hypothetical protein